MLLGAIAGTLVSGEHVHHVAKQLAKEVSANDWGLTAL